jgi:uncharacterized membrane protein YkoI
MTPNRLAFILAASLALAAFGPGVAPSSAQTSAQQRSITAEDAVRIAKSRGMVRVEEVERDNGKWEVEGKDNNGRELEIEIDARTGKVIKIERD